MIKNVFLDANILIDIFDDTRRFHEYSFKALEYLIKNEVDIYTSSDIITTVYYNLKRQNLDSLKYIKYLSTICKLVGFGNDELEEAILLMEKDKQFSDLEDTIQYVLASSFNCDVIISNDKNFPEKEINVVTSEEFCNEYM